VFLPWITSYFVADDWSVIARNAHVSWQDVPQWFVTVRFGWYRPLFELFVALCWKLFGLNPVGYHLMSILLYTLLSATVGILGELLTDDWRVGGLSTVLFAVLGCHAEPVLWFSATNELMAGLFTACGITSYVLFRRTGMRFWLLASGIGYLLGITSKETAAFLPFMLLAYDVLLFYAVTNKRLSWRSLSPLIPFVLLGMIFVLFRLSGGSPYSVTVTIPRLIMNFMYYMAIEVFALPSNYAYVASLPLWRVSPWLPTIPVTLATSIMAMIGWLLIRSQDWRGDGGYTRALSFAVVLTIAALASVILIVSERTAFVSSIGVVLALSILFVCGWNAVREYGKWAKQVVTIAIILYIGTNASVLVYRGSRWGKAGETSRTVLMELNSQIVELPANAEVWLVNLPDHLEYAYTFRNTFPSASELLNYDHNIQVVLDTELTMLSPQHREDYISQLRDHPSATVFWYENGMLVPKW